MALGGEMGNCLHAADFSPPHTDVFYLGLILRGAISAREVLPTEPHSILLHVPDVQNK